MSVMSYQKSHRVPGATGPFADLALHSHDQGMQLPSSGEHSVGTGSVAGRGCWVFWGFTRAEKLTPQLFNVKPQVGKRLRQVSNEPIMEAILG